MRTHGADALLHALRHFGQRIVVNEPVLLCVHILQSLLVGQVFSHALDHIPHPARHLRPLLGERSVDTTHLHRLRQSAVARDDAAQQLAVVVADVAEPQSQLENERLGIGRHRLLALVVEPPPAGDETVVGDSHVGQTLRLICNISSTSNIGSTSSVGNISSIELVSSDCSVGSVSSNCSIGNIGCICSIDTHHFGTLHSLRILLLRAVGSLLVHHLRMVVRVVKIHLLCFDGVV